MSAQILLDNIRDAQSVFGSLTSLAPQVEQAAQLLGTALLSGNKLLACGNGGSAADASHLTTELVVRFNADRRPYPAISFTANGGDLTACGNDYHFDEVFARQVRAYGLPGDVLFAFTTSGNSTNVVKALQTAKQHGVKTVAFLGKDGGKCVGLAGIELLVAHKVTARIQEAHKLLLHSICEIVEVQLDEAARRGEQPLT